MSGISHWQAYTASVYARRDAVLANIATIETALVNASASLKPSYAISGPEGSQSVDWAGELAQLNNSLTVQMDILDKLNDLILKFPYQRVSRGV